MTALLQYLEFRNFGLLKKATPFICSKGRFVSQGVSIVAKTEKESQGGAGEMSRLRIRLRSAASVCLSILLQNLTSCCVSNRFNVMLKLLVSFRKSEIYLYAIEMVPALVAVHMVGRFS